MAGIEEAYNQFVKRISSKEEEVHPYDPQDEYGDPQTGDKKIPLIQGIIPGHDFQNTMPNFYMQKPYYNYQNIPNQYDQNQPYYQQELSGGGATGYPPIKNFDYNEDQDELGNNMFGQTIADNKNELFFGPVEKGKTLPVIEGGGTRELKDYIKNQTTRGLGIGYSGPESGLTAIKPLFNTGDRRPLLEGYYKPDENRMFSGSISPTQQSINYAYGGDDESSSGMNIGFSRDKQFGSPYYMLNFGARYENGGRVNMSDGGEVDTNLTRTIPPVHGPSPYGIESMFKKRYN